MYKIPFKRELFHFIRCFAQIDNELVTLAENNRIFKKDVSGENEKHLFNKVVNSTIEKLPNI